MKKSTSKTVRDILIIICIIVVAVVVKELITSSRTPKRPLETVDTEASDEHDHSAHGPQGGGLDAGMMGHGGTVFPQGDDTVVASTLGVDITQAGLYKSGNKAVGAGVELPEDEEVAKGMREAALMFGLQDILWDICFDTVVESYDIDVAAVRQKALDDWIKRVGAETFEEAIAMFEMPTVTRESQARLQAEQKISELLVDAVKKEQGLTEIEEVSSYVNDHVTEVFDSLEIEFKDEELESIWVDFLETSSSSGGDPHGGGAHG